MQRGKNVTQHIIVQFAVSINYYRFFFISSATEVMFYPAFVCLSVCLSVCLLTTSRKTTDWIFKKNFTTDLSLDKEELIKVWKSSALSIFERTLNSKLN